MPIQSRDQSPARDGFFRRVLIVVAIGVLVLFLWRILDVLLLIFGAVLIAVMLRALARPIARHTPLGEGVALAVSGLLIVATLVLAGWLFGAEVQGQAADLIERVPPAWASLQNALGMPQLGDRLADQAGSAVSGGVVSGLAGLAMSVTHALTAGLLLCFGGAFLALDPALYRNGALALIPGTARPRFAAALDASGDALRLWLTGQVVSMAIVGVLTGVGLWLIGLPSALALALLAGLAEFVPLIGPVVAAVPGLLVALSVGPDTALWTLLVYLVVQQVESNMITPLVQRRAVSLPPALTLFAVVAIGTVFGPLGLLLATPLTVVGFVMVKELYIRDTLGEPTTIPGEA